MDGDLTNLGFHTIEAPNQNVTIDLGKVRRIFRVVVYNRADCCQQRAVPLKIEVSQDNKKFRQVALNGKSSSRSGKPTSQPPTRATCA